MKNFIKISGLSLVLISALSAPGFAAENSRLSGDSEAAGQVGTGQSGEPDCAAGSDVTGKSVVSDTVSASKVASPSKSNKGK